MDEPTSAITGREVAKLFEIIRSLKAKGIAIIYISHKMDEIFRISDTITVLRDGQYIETRPAAQLDHDTLVKLMVGPRNQRAVSQSEFGERRSVARSGRAVETRIVSRHQLQGQKRRSLGFRRFDGRGPDRSDGNGFWLAPGRRRQRENQRRGQCEFIRPPTPSGIGVALITEDRQLKGLNLKASVKDNITLVNLKEFSRFGQILQFKKENSAADAEIEKLRIKTRNRNQIVKTLSGGNQQKVVLAKWLLNDPEIIILDEPTRGIDIGAKAEIYKIIARAGRAGQNDHHDFVGVGGDFGAVRPRHCFVSRKNHRANLSAPPSTRKPSSKPRWEIGSGGKVERKLDIVTRWKTAINNWRTAGAFFSKYGIYFAFVLLAGTLAVISPPFRTLSNAENILQQISVNGIMAVGMTLVIITAGIDLSVGSVLALSAVVADFVCASRRHIR